MLLSTPSPTLTSNSHNVQRDPVEESHTLWSRGISHQLSGESNCHGEEAMRPEATYARASYEGPAALPALPSAGSSQGPHAATAPRQDAAPQQLEQPAQPATPTAGSTTMQASLAPQSSPSSAPSAPGPSSSSSPDPMTPTTAPPALQLFKKWSFSGVSCDFGNRTIIMPDSTLDLETMYGILHICPAILINWMQLEGFPDGQGSLHPDLLSMPTWCDDRSLHSAHLPGAQPAAIAGHLGAENSHASSAGAARSVPAQSWLESAVAVREADIKGEEPSPATETIRCYRSLENLESALDRTQEGRWMSQHL